MHAALHTSWAIVLGAEAPVLSIPWHDETGRVAYVDLRACPGCIQEIPEARENPPLAAVLTRLNAADSPWATAKCDRWTLDEDDLQTASFDLDRESAQAGIGSYIDFYHCDPKEFASLDRHRELLLQWTCTAERLSSAKQPTAMLELTLRRCVAQGSEGYAVTAFLYAIGQDAAEAEVNWAAALDSLAHILLSKAASAIE